MTLRQVRWPFFYAWLIVLSAWAISHAACTPLLAHSDPDVQREFVNLYQIACFPNMSTGTVQNLTIVNGTASTMTATGYMSWPHGMVIYSTSSADSTDTNITDQNWHDTGLTVTAAGLHNSANIYRVRWVHGTALNVGGSTSEIGLDVRIVRDSTAIKTSLDVTEIRLGTVAGTNLMHHRASDSYDDRPGDTSSHVYKTQATNRQGVGTVSITDSSDGAGYIVVEEVSSP